MAGFGSHKSDLKMKDIHLGVRYKLGQMIIIKGSHLGDEIFKTWVFIKLEIISVVLHYVGFAVVFLCFISPQASTADLVGE